MPYPDHLDASHPRSPEYRASAAEREADEHADAVAACGDAGEALNELAAQLCDATALLPETWFSRFDGDAVAINAVTSRLREFLVAEGLL